MNAVVRLEFTPPEARVGSSGAVECQRERTVTGRLVARWRYRYRLVTPAGGTVPCHAGLIEASLRSACPMRNEAFAAARCAGAGRNSVRITPATAASAPP